MTAFAVARPDLHAFYGAFSPVCFTLLGLWLIVVQTRHSEWRHSAVHRSRAYTLSLNFALPGMMALLSLIDPANSALWRASFACVAFAGVLALLWMALLGPGRGKHPPVSVFTTYLATLLYLVIGLLAVAPHLVKDVGVHLRPLECEAILLSTLVFIAVNVAWLLLFDDVKVKE
ncbi:MAG: hypothetical protein M3071_08625 [Actinomycetota bacterium]|nr:hypothetical protein [Actinomycetota bacterium]